jgi:hypothetical protein
LPANIVSCSVKLPRKHCAPGGRASLPHTASLTDELTSGSYGDEVIIRLTDHTSSDDVADIRACIREHIPAPMSPG